MKVYKFTCYTLVHFTSNINGALPSSVLLAMVALYRGVPESMDGTEANLSLTCKERDTSAGNVSSLLNAWYFSLALFRVKEEAEEEKTRVCPIWVPVSS